ncbi:hypothetical protein HWV62_38664 [Athelia sp. TMB]|nr:hypothetical protein HWV62_38664 [Athelia sp. TMB]
MSLHVFPIAQLSFAFVFVFIFRFIYRQSLVRYDLRHVPGPKSSSLIWGEEWKLYHDAPGALYANIHKEFGKVVKFTGAFGHQMLSISDPRAISFIVGEGTYLFPKPSGVRAWFKALLGEGILWVEGKEAHEKQRRVLKPALNPQSVRELTSIFYEVGAKLAAQWTQEIDRNGSDESEIEVTYWAGRFALDAIGMAAFSYDFNCLSGEPSALADSLDGLTNNENSLSSFYMRALFWIFPPILKIGSKGSMIRQVRSVLGDIANQLWRDAKIAGANDKTFMSIMRKGFANMYIQQCSRSFSVNAESDASSQHMTEEEIASQLRSVIQAAYEPVSATIAWTLYELSINPKLQEELREELATAGDPTFDELKNEFPILDAVLKEVLRIHPPILENHHQADETITLPLSEPLPGTTDMHLIIPKGTILEIPLNIIQRDPLVWGPDADLFRPRRWLERESGGHRRQDLFAFSDGPRQCMGREFASAEIKALTVTLLRQFSFSCYHDIEAFQSFVIRPRIKGQGASSLPLLVRKDCRAQPEGRKLLMLYMDYELAFRELFARGLLVITLLGVARVLAWLVNLLVVLPFFDPLSVLAGPDGSLTRSHFPNITQPAWSPIFHKKWATKYGNVFRFHGMGRYDYRLMLLDMRAVSHVLNSPAFEKPWQTRTFLSRLVGRGIFSADGEEHRRQRKIIAPAFSTQAIRAYTPTFRRKAEELADRWDTLLAESPKSPNEEPQESSPQSVVDINNWLTRATFDIIGLTAFDYVFDSLRDPTEEVYLAFREMFDMADRLSGILTLIRVHFTWLERFMWDKDARVTRNSRRTIIKAGKKLIDDKKAAVLADKGGSGDVHHTDLLSRMNEILQLPERIALCTATSSDPANRDGSPPSLSSDQDIAWADAVDSLPYLDAVVRETLRLGSPVHAFLRTPKEDTVIPLSSPVKLRDGKEAMTIRVRKGTYIHIPIEGLNTNEDIWGNDALNFNPDRWMDLPENAKAPKHPGFYNLMTFSFGRQSCLGWKYSILEAKIFLAVLLPHFVFAPAATIARFNAILTRPYVKDQFKQGERLPISISRYQVA